MSTLVAMLSAAVAVYAAYWSRRTARVSFAHTAYELARTLHTDLTTGTTAQARDVLEHFRSGTRYQESSSDDLPPTAETQKVLEAYFTLLWCFERILVGRRVLVFQARRNQTGSAVAFLDRLLAWHLVLWADRWPGMRTALKAPGRVPDLRDHHSLRSFCDLVEEMTGTRAHTALLRARIEEEEEQGIGVT
ncbi:hypothetical protein ABZV60_23455 [Streptomyces sp. NPDC004787]|uniref:hypothetical protein n=1 Tax=Streptomyces sp. NPDC004787 TaxID=3154291 RepID=UPI0033A3426C